MADITKTLRDAAYVTIGLGVIGFQRAQVRRQELTKQLALPLLATAPFAAAVAGPWRPVGEHVLRGLETPMPILAAG